MTNQTIGNLSNIPEAPIQHPSSQSQTLLSIHDQLQQLQQISQIQQQPFDLHSQQLASHTTNRNRNVNHQLQQLQLRTDLSNRDSTGNSNIPDHFQPLSIDSNQDALAGDNSTNTLDDRSSFTTS